MPDGGRRAGPTAGQTPDGAARLTVRPQRGARDRSQLLASLEVADDGILNTSVVFGAVLEHPGQICLCPGNKSSGLISKGKHPPTVRQAHTDRHVEKMESDGRDRRDTRFRAAKSIREAFAC